MTMIVQFKDGKTHQGTATEIVTQMRLGGLVAPHNNIQYMADVAHRLTVWNGATITYTNEAEFLAELLRLDLVTIEEKGTI